MLGLLSSQLAFSAATTLAKKTFEFSITSSLKGLSDVIRERFSNSQALQDTQAELEAKVRMLCLPVDLLAHYATRGNTALQEPLGVALGLMEEVEAFRQALVQQHVARAQEGTSPDAASATQLCKRLRDLISRLDSLLPYLNLAITTAVLLGQGGGPAPISYSRLMAASWHLRAHPAPGAAVFSLPEASWHEERQLTAAGPRMGELFRLCSLTICRAAPAGSQSGGGPAAPGLQAEDSTGATAPPSPAPAAAAAAAASPAAAALAPSSQASLFSYELVVQQSLEDGLYHEREERPATLRLQVADIAALEWETTQSLRQGENEFRPALVLHVWQGGSPTADQQPAAAAVAGEASPGLAGLGEQPVTPDAGPASSRPASRAASSRRGGAPSTTTGTERRAAAAAALPTAAGQPDGTPDGAAGQLVTPAGAARAGNGGGLGGSVRRYAIVCSPQHPDTDGEEEEEQEGEGRSEWQRGPAGGSPPGSSDGSEAGGSGRGGAFAAAAMAGLPFPPPAAGGGGAALQREWQVLGELEFVLRLCILESREQAPHWSVTDERLALGFQDTSAAGAGLASLPTLRPPTTAAPHDSALHRRDSAAAARWRTAAAGVQHALHVGVDAVTAGVRQLSFTPGHPAGGGQERGAEGGEPAASSSELAGGRRRTRSASRQAGGSGFGSPVQ